MLRAQLKILFALLALGFLGAIVFGAYYVYKKEFLPDSAAQKRINQHKKGPPPDPGKNKYIQAVDSLKAGDLASARARLLELVRHYKESSKYNEAKRIIGEINMDALMEPKVGPGKKEYVVQRGDSLSKIASKNSTTIDCIQRSNGMLNSLLHPGDRLIVFPLEFSIVIDLDEKILALMRKERFFKEYPIREARIPTSVRVPFETTISDKAAWKDDRRVSSSSSSYLGADKWLQLKTGRVVINGGNPKKGAAGDLLPQGIFLDRPDMEELFTIIRTKTPVKVVR